MGVGGAEGLGPDGRIWATCHVIYAFSFHITEALDSFLSQSSDSAEMKTMYFLPLMTYSQKSTVSNHFSPPWSERPLSAPGRSLNCSHALMSVLFWSVHHSAVRPTSALFSGPPRGCSSCRMRNEPPASRGPHTLSDLAADHLSALLRHLPSSSCCTGLLVGL